MKTLLKALILSLAAVALVATAAAADAGTVVIINRSLHRTGKLGVREGSTTVAKLGQHEWTEIQLPAGEHVLYPANDKGHEAVIKVEPGKRTYLLLNFRAEFLAARVELYETSAMEGEHWLREYAGKERQLEAKK